MAGLCRRCIQQARVPVIARPSPTCALRDTWYHGVQVPHQHQLNEGERRKTSIRPGFAGVLQGCLGLDSFTVSLHSPNGRQLPAVRVVQGDCQWPLTTVEISISDVSPQCIATRGNCLPLGLCKGTVNGHWKRWKFPSVTWAHNALRHEVILTYI